MPSPGPEFRRIWLMAVLRLSAWLMLAAAIGSIFGVVTLALLIALAIYTGGHLLFAYRLHRWLVDPRAEPRDGIGIWEEIHTELYRLRQRNRRRKKRLKNILAEFQSSTAALPDGAVVIDGRGRIVWFNNAAAALLGLRAGQDNGQRIVNLLRHPRFAQFLVRPDNHDGQLEIPAPANDAATLLLRMVPYGDGQRLLIARDISDQKRLESTRRDFVANASHELRTPLTVLRGYLDMMSEASEEGGEFADWQAPVREMEVQSARMGRIIDSMLQLARVESEGATQTQTTIDMPGLIKQQVAAIEASGNHDHNIVLDVDASLSLFGRLGEIESVVANLLANAVRYTPAAGQIKVRWQAEPGRLLLEVIDDGPGISAEHLPRLTERFYRVDPGRAAAEGGTGLGLAIVKHSLEHHEAELRVRSQPGQGSTFCCVFPLQRRVVRAVA